jgi:hypothetical protein
MDEQAKKYSCKIAGLEYLNGSIVCRSGECERCDNGFWEETGTYCPCWTGVLSAEFTREDDRDFKNPRRP